MEVNKEIDQALKVNGFSRGERRAYFKALKQEIQEEERIARILRTKFHVKV